MKKSVKRTIALFLSITMVVSMLMFGTSAAEPSGGFTDIAGNPHAQAIEALAEAGLVSGFGNGIYGPDIPTSRAMAVTVLAHMAGVSGKVSDAFSDVSPDSWYAKYVGWAADKGIVTGIGGGLFEPERTITGEELDQMLANYAKAAGIAYTNTNTSKDPVNRAEMAEMVYSLYTQDSPLLVETKYGSVRGFVKDNGARVWLGVPYGQAERWERPTAPDTWTTVMNCTTAGDVAIQAKSDWRTGKTTIDGSEDCLNLDVYAPEGAKDLPVLVFLHGGNNQTGNTSELYGTDIVYTNNCVYVTLNYRLNLLGFNPLPALKTGKDDELDSGNYTLLDIALALDWVKENIAAFGGNPDNITISGFSAGGRDVMALLISPLFKGKFNQAIAFSGGMTVADEEMSAVQIAHYMAPLAVEDGKAADLEAAAAWLLSDSKEVADYLKGLSAERLASLIGDAGIHMALFPHLFTDGTVLPKEGFQTTKYNSVPVLMLTGSEEFSFFKNYGYLQSEEYRALDNDVKTAASDFAMKYGSDMYRIFNGQESANTMYANYDAPIYICQIDYKGDGTGTAGHGVFKAFMDSNQGFQMVDATSPGGQQVSEKYNAYLTNFLHTGDPNGKGLDKWTPWDPATQLSMVFDGDTKTGTATLKNVARTYQDIIDEMIADATISQDIKTEIINTVLNGRWFSAAQDEYFDAPSLWIADRIACSTNIPYIDDGDEDHLLDVYGYREDAEATPVIIEIHGGGFIGGTKETNTDHSMVYAREGFMVVTPNYTHLPKGNFKTIIQEMFTVMDWVAEHAEEYHFDLDHVFISGDSAGAAISSLVAATISSDEMREYYEVDLPSFEIKGYALTCPTVDVLSFREDLDAPGWKGIKANKIGTDILNDDEVMNMAHVYNHLNSNYPEVYILTTPTDTEFYQMAVDFDAALTEKGIDHEYHVYTGEVNTLGHTFNINHMYWPESIRANADIIAYLKSLCE